MIKIRWGTKPNKKTRGRKEQPEKASFYRLTWRNWFFLAGVLSLTILGLSTALPPLINERIVHPWPWVKTDLVLIIGLSISILAFIGYMTQQQRHLLNINRKMQLLMEESDRRMNKHISRLYALIKLGRKLAEESDLQSVFHCITDMCVEVFDCQRASLMLYDEDTNELVLRAVSGRKCLAIIDTRQALGEGIAGKAAQRHQAILLTGDNDVEKYPDLKLTNDEITSSMVVPITLRNELVGVINVTSGNPDIIYDHEDLQALQVFAENTGAFIRRAEQAHWMRQTIKKLQAGRKRESSDEPNGRELTYVYGNKERDRDVSIEKE